MRVSYYTFNQVLIPTTAVDMDFFLLEQNNTFPGTWYAVIDLASVFIYLLADLFIYIIKDHWGKVAFSCQEKQYTQGYINFLNLSYFSQQGT